MAASGDGDHEAAPVPRQGQDQGRRDPVRGSRTRTCSPDRLDAVLAVIYLIYNEGYSGRVDLAAEAIRLDAAARHAHAGRAGGTRAARPDDDPSRPAAGPVLRPGSRAARRPGPVAVGHARRSPRDGRRSTGRSRRAAAAPTSSRRRSRRCKPPNRIDWPQVAGLYRRLAELTGSPRWTRGQGAPSACAPAAPPHEPIRPGGRSPAAMGLVVFRSPSLPLSRLAPPRVLQSVGGSVCCASRMSRTGPAVPPAGSGLIHSLFLTQEFRIAPERQIRIAPSRGRWSVARAPARQLLSGAWW